MSSEDPSSFVLRDLMPADADAYRELRLEALASAPAAFGSSYEEEIRLSLDEFRARIPDTGPNRIFAAFSRDRLVGMAGFVVQDRLKARHKGILWGVYVRPEARGRGLGDALVRQVVDHAARHVVVIEAAVGLFNESARRTYHKLGFKPYGIERKAIRIDDIFYDEELLFIDFSEHA
ncbi:GNAT family N-acetyltransferase [Microvirga puerhi]|uniref:GNAT family N-acetyltransferase n=1 Tax=Microvirga puerhi TaxID=2876078 RepID=A0ABS7VLY3_9HYPH|nr:GNAT family N-acetyltransferase [Microvirga puerhi]MBZ6076171.1 GNAT family N-acetyltransferase [Microvirga puerhi]